MLSSQYDVDMHVLYTRTEKNVKDNRFDVQNAE